MCCPGWVFGVGPTTGHDVIVMEWCGDPGGFVHYPVVLVCTLFAFMVGRGVGSWCLVVGYSGSLWLIELSLYGDVVTLGGLYGCRSRVTSMVTSLLTLCMSCPSGRGGDRMCCFWCSGESTSHSCQYSSLYHPSWSSLITSEVSPNCAAAEFGCTNKSGLCCGCTYSTGG